MQCGEKASAPSAAPTPKSPAPTGRGDLRREAVLPPWQAPPAPMVVLAVPAQRRAGVTKGYRQEAGQLPGASSQKPVFRPGGHPLPRAVRGAGDYLDQLTEAKLGWQYLEDLKNGCAPWPLVCEEAGGRRLFSSGGGDGPRGTQGLRKSFETRLSAARPQLAP